MYHERTLHCGPFDPDLRRVLGIIIERKELTLLAALAPEVLVLALAIAVHVLALVEADGVLKGVYC